ncbi:hypothetical protein GOP47_0023540 [Adiantum capillus-veneris]|uniref:Uncharacterized protein n=1 Tax=Adiantum capillus-veneris TaxID=13818 RepID=A0A9D4U4P7_ADICA|nr:hypothetical protein GOP47_0023540 [Adiantum capillus-veneris]
MCVFERTIFWSIFWVTTLLKFEWTSAHVCFMPVKLQVDLLVKHLGMIALINPLKAVGISLSGVHTIAVVIAGIFVLFAVTLSTFLIFEHLSWYNNPEEQKWIIGVVLIVPLYAVESYVSLCSSHAALVFEIVRDCYEAFALYSFGRYLIACLGGEEKTMESMERQAVSGPRTPLLVQTAGRAAVKHSFPLSYILQPWDLGKQFYQAFKFGIVQFMILKTLGAMVALVLQCWGLYGEGEFKWNRGYLYVAVVINFSQSWALYCLMQFYNVTKEELAPIRPLAKFLCFKSIVFLTWWQGLLIAIFCAMQSDKFENEESLEARIQDFVICIEMGFAAVAHVYVLPAKPYQLMGSQKRGSVSVMSDYAAIDMPPDPEEVKDLERPTVKRLPYSEIAEIGTSVKDSMHDLVFKGGEYVINDVNFAVGKVRDPVQKGFGRLKATMHRDHKKQVKDDSWIPTIRGIDDPLLIGSISDSAAGKRKAKKYPYTYKTADSSGESSDQGLGDYHASGHRWTFK